MENELIKKGRELREKAKADLQNALDQLGLDSFYATYLSKKGSLKGLLGNMKDVAPQERGETGSAINSFFKEINDAYEERKRKLEEEKRQKKLESETIDVTLPGRKPQTGFINPYHLIIDEVTDIFISMGYEVIEGRDVETDLYNFELLNVPKDHPSRDMQDTFYLNADKLLRTQTSAAQAHTMLERSGDPKPIRMICPGKAYRRDDDDQTHSHQFAQIEGLVVDKDISIANLKATLELFARKMFGEKREIRLRSSYFPFTEPSVEVDVSCFACGGKGCSTCKGTGWIEILGAGMVNPKVLRDCGYDPEVWTGFAFGVGVERVAMLRYGIDDIRRFYSDDLRFLSDFTGK